MSPCAKHSLAEIPGRIFSDSALALSMPLPLSGRIDVHGGLMMGHHGSDTSVGCSSCSAVAGALCACVDKECVFDPCSLFMAVALGSFQWQFLKCSCPSCVAGNVTIFFHFSAAFRCADGEGLIEVRVCEAHLP